jgi:hypothetical protein
VVPVTLRLSSIITCTSAAWICVLYFEYLLELPNHSGLRGEFSSGSRAVEGILAQPLISARLPKALQIGNKKCVRSTLFTPWQRGFLAHRSMSSGTHKVLKLPGVLET